MDTLTARAGAQDIVPEPFPHLIIKNALGSERTEKLRAAFPPPDVVAEGRPLGSNHRFSYPASKSLNDDRVPEIWKAFVHAHISQEFLDDLFRIFGEGMRSTHPQLTERYGSFDGLRVGTRNIDDLDTADVLLDAQISMNTPVTEPPNSVRGPHVDAVNKIFTGLYYLRHPDDDSTGGALELYRYKTDRFRFHSGQHVDSRYIERVKRIEYEDDTLVLFPNSIRSLHGVTVRQKTTYPRMFLNIVAEADVSLYDVHAMQENALMRFLRRRGLLEDRTTQYQENI